MPFMHSEATRAQRAAGRPCFARIRSKTPGSASGDASPSAIAARSLASFRSWRCLSTRTRVAGTDPLLDQRRRARRLVAPSTICAANSIADDVDGREPSLRGRGCDVCADGHLHPPRSLALAPGQSRARAASAPQRMRDVTSGPTVRRLSRPCPAPVRDSFAGHSTARSSRRRPRFSELPSLISRHVELRAWTAVGQAGRRAAAPRGRSPTASAWPRRRAVRGGMRRQRPRGREHRRLERP